MTNMWEKLKAAGAEVSFDIEGEKKGDPIRIKGTIWNQFAPEGRWLKGDLHCHLKESRWEGNAENAIDFYSGLGYDFIAGMEHDRVIELESRPDFLVLPGVEVSPGHFLAFGLDDFTFPEVDGDKTTRTKELIQIVRERGGIAALAHPFKSSWSWDDLNVLCDAGLSAIEVVNSNIRGKTADTGRSDQIWKLLMQDGRYLAAFGGDDAHGPHEDPETSAWGGAPLVAWTGILVEEFTEEGILDAMRRGRTYASEGPIFHSIEFHPDGRLVVSCSPCVACHFRSGGGSYGGSSAFPPAGKEESGEFVFDLGVTGYRVQDSIIVVLQDCWGRRAWLSPIPLEISYS